jgi:hypothetical protein
MPWRGAAHGLAFVWGCKIIHLIDGYLFACPCFVVILFNMIILTSTRASEAHTLDGDDLPPDIRGGLPALGSFINGMYFGCKALATKQAALFEPLTAKAATMVTDDIFGAVTSLAAIREAAGFLEDGQRFGDHMLHTTVDLLGEISGSFGVGALGEIGGKMIGTVVGSAIGGPVGGITGGQLGWFCRNKER